MKHAQFGGWIRERREYRGLSLRALAKTCGFASSHLCEIEGGDHLPSVRVATLLALHLNLDRDEVLLRARHVPPDIQTLLEENPRLCSRLREMAA